MRRCPECHSTYTDDSLKYCLQDGAQLVAFNLSQAETLINPQISSPKQEASKANLAPVKEQVLISISEMLQLLLELDPTTNTLEDYQGGIRWIRTKDKSEIDDIDRNTISALLNLGLLVAGVRQNADSTHSVFYTLTEKAKRIIQARDIKSPTHDTPYLGEKFWLVVHTHRKGVEIYPYLGTEPPDLGMLTEPGWKAKEYIDSFIINCYPLDTRIALEELLQKNKKSI